MKKNRFQTPPPSDPLAAGRNSSLVFRLNSDFFLRQLGIFLAMDLLLVVLAGVGLALYAENRCADAAALVAQQGLPSAQALPWMEAGSYTITPLDRPAAGYSLPDWLPLRPELDQGLRSWQSPCYYRVELPHPGQPYAIQTDLSGSLATLYWAGIALLVCQGISLLTNLFRNNRSIRKVLRPIQDLTAAAARLNTHNITSRRELDDLAGELDKINAGHLDSRLDLRTTQKELRGVAQAINQMLDRVNAAYSAQTRFVSDASHELRTPIAVIQGYAALLDRWGKSDPEALQESIDAIRSEAASMERLVEQLLFLARGDNDSQPVHPQRLDLTRLAEEVLREEEMIHPQRCFLPRWDERVVTVCADPGLMKQLMRILVDNSVKYSPPEGRIYLWVGEYQGFARVTVQDEGMGIPPQSIPHIFDRFYRADQSRARKTGGTGLGLSIAKWIVDRHGGWFEVASRVDVGTRITFVLPLAAPEPQE